MKILSHAKLNENSLFSNFAYILKTIGVLISIDWVLTAAHCVLRALYV